MNESLWTSSITSWLRKNGLVAFKLADGYTTGVPDLVVIGYGHTSWMEMKFIRQGERIYDRVHERETQWLMMVGVSNLNGGATFYIIHMPDGKMYASMPEIFRVRRSNDEYLQNSKLVTLATILEIVRDE